MASVRIRSPYRSRQRLPDICMKCGQPSETVKDKQFAWYPPWVWVTILAGLLPFIIIAAVLTKRMRVQAPLCYAHSGHWLMRQLLLVGTFFVLLALGFAAAVLLSDRKTEPLGGMACIGVVFLLVAWIVLAIVVQVSTIRPTEITDYDITLTGVAQEFAEAYHQGDPYDAPGLDYRAAERWNRRDPYGPEPPYPDRPYPDRPYHDDPRYPRDPQGPETYRPDEE
jgi:hypothetical protein